MIYYQELLAALLRKEFAENNKIYTCTDEFGNFYVVMDGISILISRKYIKNHSATFIAEYIFTRNLRNLDGIKIKIRGEIEEEVYFNLPITVFQSCNNTSHKIYCNEVHIFDHVNLDVIEKLVTQNLHLKAFFLDEIIDSDRTFPYVNKIHVRDVKPEFDKVMQVFPNLC
jgi:transcription termination factor Rho